MVISAYLKKFKRQQINDVTIPFKDIGKQEQTKPNINTKTGIIKIGEKITKLKQKNDIKNP